MEVIPVKHFLPRAPRFDLYLDNLQEVNCAKDHGGLVSLENVTESDLRTIATIAINDNHYPIVFRRTELQLSEMESKLLEAAEDKDKMNSGTINTKLLVLNMASIIHEAISASNQITS